MVALGSQTGFQRNHGKGEKTVVLDSKVSRSSFVLSDLVIPASHCHNASVADRVVFDYWTPIPNLLPHCQPPLWMLGKSKYLLSLLPLHLRVAL